MALQIIEGSWEEIERRKAELIGHHLRVIVIDEPAAERPQATRAAGSPAVRVSGRVSAMGKYAGQLSSEDYMREKQADIDLEDRADSRAPRLPVHSSTGTVCHLRA